MGYVQLALAVIGIAKEIFKFYNRNETENKECAQKLKEFKKSENFEKMFTDVLNK